MPWVAPISAVTTSECEIIAAISLFQRDEIAEIVTILGWGRKINMVNEKSRRWQSNIETGQASILNEEVLIRAASGILKFLDDRIVLNFGY